MTRCALLVVPLPAQHDRTTFDSGSAPLDNYFQQRITQDIRRRVAACFVALTADGQVAGYYTLASASLVLATLPPETARSEIAAFAMTVDAKNEAALTFYLHHGFIPLPNSPISLFLPLATVSP